MRAAMRVGVFDSGVGGLSVWREIVRQWPALATDYVADQANVPYGARSADDIRAWSRGIARFLVEQRCDGVVVACNTASAAALSALRAEFAPLPFVGMEPAVKPAAAGSRTRVAAVLATPATFQGELFATTVERFTAGVRLVPIVCAGLVERIEAGDAGGAATEALVREALRPAIAAGADTVVLACTHYPFARAAIERVMGSGVTVIDPAPAVARQLGRVLGLAARRAEAGAPAMPEHRFATTGSAAEFARVASALLGYRVDARAANREGGRIVVAP
jgi:glutamate racemase